MQPIIIPEKIFIDEDGLITIPQAILDLYDINEPIDVDIRLMHDGTIEIIFPPPFLKNFCMHSSQEITERLSGTYLQGKENDYVSDQEIDDMLKD